MKKLFKQISKTFLIAIMAIVTTLTFVGCGNTTSSKNSNINASEITDTNTGNEDKDKADNVSDSDDKKDQEVSEKIELYGIYKYTRELNFDDCDRSNSEEVIKYFKTRDFNGVYNAIKPLGFDKFISNKDDDGNELMFYFNGELFTYITSNNGKYEINNTSSKVEEKIEKIEANQDGTYTLFIAFEYENTKTPLLIKFSITKIANTENLLTDNTFTYTASSAIINYDINSNATKEDVYKVLANMFNLEVSEDLNTEIQNILGSKLYGFNKDLSRLSIIDRNGEISETISFAMANSNNEFTIDGLTYKLEKHYSILSSSEYIELSINIIDNTKLIFTIA